MDKNDDEEENGDSTQSTFPVRISADSDIIPHRNISYLYPLRYKKVSMPASESIVKYEALSSYSHNAPLI